MVAAFLHRDLVAGAADDHHVLDRRRSFAGLVDAALQRHEVAAAPALVGGDDRDRRGVVHAVADRVGAEPAEDHRVRRADPGAGQHRHRELRDHRHVDADPVAALDAERAQRVREPADAGEQLRVGDRAGVAALALEVVRDLLAPSRLDVAVEAVVGDVELAPEEPLGEGEVPFQDLVERAVPADVLLRLLGPERLGIGIGCVMEARVGDPRLGSELGARSKRASLVEQGVDGLWRSRSSRPPDGVQRNYLSRINCTSGALRQAPKVSSPSRASGTDPRQTGWLDRPTRARKAAAQVVYRRSVTLCNQLFTACNRARTEIASILAFGWTGSVARTPPIDISGGATIHHG